MNDEEFVDETENSTDSDSNELQSNVDREVEPQGSESEVEETEETEEEISEDEVNTESSEESNTNETISETTTYDTIDYSGYFENLQTIGIIIIGLLIAQAISFSFFKGIKK